MKYRALVSIPLLVLMSSCNSGGDSSGGSSGPSAQTPASDWTSTPTTLGPSVLITSVNGDYAANHAREYYVHPGDAITLSSDLMDPNDGNQLMGDSVEDFVWKASDSDTDECDAAIGNCLDSSNFQTTDYGVTYYVPYSIGESLLISVTSHDPDAVDTNGNASEDVIVLRNADYTPAYVAPTVVVVTPDAYPYSQLNPDFALAGQGHWIWIEGVRYFVPRTYVDANGDEWTPYRNGYWSWDNDNGWTWISYDPWGWMTDHYGVWRYHGIYGWVWIPFDDLHYEAHTVTWYNDGEYVGWYPYHPAFTEGYIHGYNEGFRDGYEEGYQASRHLGDSSYRGGYTVVRNTDVTHVNIVEVSNTTIINQTVIVETVNNSTTNNTFNRYPGGNQNGARSFIEGHASASAPVTQTQVYTGHGGARISNPRPERSVPPVYQTVASSSSCSKTISLGTVNRVDSSQPEQPAIAIAPTTNGKAVVAAPVLKDPSTGAYTSLPPRSLHPAQPESNNPVLGSRPVQTAPAPGTDKPTLPVFDPKKPVPAPVTAKPTPAKPAPVVSSKPLPPRPAPAPVKPAPVPVPTVQPKPIPVHTNPAPVHSEPAPVHSEPAPVHSEPAPVHSEPAPVHSEPAPVHSEPAPVHSEPAPVHSQPAPVHSEPAPVHSEPAPVHSQPAPVHSEPAPVHSEPAPVHSQPAPVHSSAPSAPSRSGGDQPKPRPSQPPIHRG